MIKFKILPLYAQKAVQLDPVLPELYITDSLRSYCSVSSSMNAGTIYIDEDGGPGHLLHEFHRQEPFRIVL